MATGDQSDNLQERIQALKLVYASSLPEKIDEIATAVGDSLEAVAALSHKVAGTAGMYGFHDLSETAGNLERLCERIAGRNSDPAEHELKQIDQLIESLRHQARADCGLANELGRPDHE